MSNQDRTNNEADQDPLDNSALDRALDCAFAASSDDEAGMPGNSVLERIGEITGSKPQVLLRDEAAGDTDRPVRGATGRHLVFPMLVSRCEPDLDLELHRGHPRHSSVIGDGN